MAMTMVGAMTCWLSMSIFQYHTLRNLIRHTSLNYQEVYEPRSTDSATGYEPRRAIMAHLAAAEYGCSGNMNSLNSSTTSPNDC
jgi:hypothetical protein